jgi:carbonic anhydrase
MQKLVNGIHKFQTEVFESQKDLFSLLAKGQSPQTLFITCSDSRIDPGLITQTAPGDIFVLRNAGNLVPPYSASNGGEVATIEYAVKVLGVQDIVVCGHSHCGAMAGLLKPESLKDLPAVRNWLQHAESTRQIILENYKDKEGDSLLNVAIQENVLVQLENLRTHPSVSARLASGKLRLHGWVYKIATGEVFGYDPKDEQFRAVTSQGAQGWNSHSGGSRPSV